MQLAVLSTPFVLERPTRGSPSPDALELILDLGDLIHTTYYLNGLIISFMLDVFVKVLKADGHEMKLDYCTSVVFSKNFYIFIVIIGNEFSYHFGLMQHM